MTDENDLILRKQITTDDHVLFIPFSPYSRNFSPVSSHTTTGMSSYLTSMSPVLDQQQQIMWPVNTQNEEFITARSGKLPEFHRFQSSTGFGNQTKNTHYTSSFCVQVSFMRNDEKFLF